MIDPEAAYIVFIRDPTGPNGHTTFTVDGSHITQVIASKARFHAFEDHDTGATIVVNLDNIIRMVRK